jgi:hypothetical protein
VRSGHAVRRTALTWPLTAHQMPEAHPIGLGRPRGERRPGGRLSSSAATSGRQSTTTAGWVDLRTGRRSTCNSCARAIGRNECHRAVRDDCIHFELGAQRCEVFAQRRTASSSSSQQTLPLQSSQVFIVKPVGKRNELPILHVPAICLVSADEQNGRSAWIEREKHAQIATESPTARRAAIGPMADVVQSGARRRTDRRAVACGA